MLFIQAIAQKNYETLEARRESSDNRYPLSMVPIKTHRNYTGNEKIQGKKKRLPSFVAFKKNLQSILPQKNVFTSKGIIQNAGLQPLNKKVGLNHLTRYRRRDKNASLGHYQTSKHDSLHRVKTPKIHIKSIFSFRMANEKEKEVVPGQYQMNVPRNIKRSMHFSFQSKRIRTQVPKKKIIQWMGNRIQQQLGAQSLIPHPFSYT